MMPRTEEFPSITSRPLTYIHKIPILKTQIFWEKLKEGEIYATKCKKCGKLYYPPQVDCPKCLSSNIEWVKLSGELTLEAYTYVQVKPQGFEKYEPYIIAIATTPEGIRIIGWMEKIKLEEIKIGMKLKAIAKILEDGFPIIKFMKV